MLEIKNLSVSIDGRKHPRRSEPHGASGEVAAIMGPNGTGKSTLSYVMAGRKDYEVDAANYCSTARTS